MDDRTESEKRADKKIERYNREKTTEAMKKDVTYRTMVELENATMVEEFNRPINKLLRSLEAIIAIPFYLAFQTTVGLTISVVVFCFLVLFLYM